MALARLSRTRARDRSLRCRLWRAGDELRLVVVVRAVAPQDAQWAWPDSEIQWKGSETKERMGRRNPTPIEPNSLEPKWLRTRNMIC